MDEEKQGVVIRRATKADLPTLGKLGAMLMRTHYAFDKARFIAPGEHSEEGYAWFLGSQLQEDDVAIWVAERGDEVLGYIYVGIEPKNWKELREEAGFVHDVAVAEAGRRSGVASALLDAGIAWLREKGVPRVVLWTAEKNDGAQKLFARFGFRRTMIEMTRELA